MPARLKALTFACVRLSSTVLRSYIEFYALAGTKIRYASLVALVTFPGFYFIWTEVLPQPFESISLRVIGTALCAMLFLTPYWPSRLKRHAMVFSYLTLIYCCPFFFTAMLLMNGVSTVWQLSLMAALVYVVFLIDTPNILPACLIGSVGGIVYYLLMSGEPIPAAYWTTLPIFAFSLLAMILLNHSGDLIVRERMRAASVLAAHIAHEMRTPLAAIQLDAAKAGEYLPHLIDAHAFALKHGWNGRHLTTEQARRLAVVLDRIERQSTSAHQIIDTLLMYVAAPTVAPHTGNGR